MGVQIDSLRKFYSSLHEQIPGSEMAEKWCALEPETRDRFERGVEIRLDPFTHPDGTRSKGFHKPCHTDIATISKEIQ